jgi:tetratricopeptide (TPR) repeat protein
MNQKLLRMYHFITGMIELERKNLAQAIKNFKDALSLLDYQYKMNTEHALFIEPLALAYYKSGDLERAYEEYERIISLTGGRTFWGDIYAKSFYMLGKIYEQKGWKGKAIEHYEKFLDLWKDADPGLPEVEDTKKRLAELQIK